MGIRTRLLWFVLPVAALAVVLSVVVVRQVTTDQLQDQVRADDQVTERISSALNDYSFTGVSWAAAEPLLVDLAGTQSIRIAITDLEGEVLLDTARILEGEIRPLPQTASGYIDPDNPAFGLEVSPEVLAYWDELAQLFDDCMAAAGFGDYLTDELFFNDGALEDLENQLELCSVETYDVDPFLAASDSADGFGLSDGDPFLVPELSPLEPVLLFLGERGDTASVLDTTIDSRMIASVVVILLVAVLATYLFARRTLGPISALTDAAHQVAAGGTPEPVEVVGDTELSELAVAFNSMGDTLRHEDEARRRLTTDIAHELRSPLQNLRGTVESAQDGISDLDDELLESLHEDTMMLQRLVDDLQVLALADASRLHLQRESVEIDDLLELTFRRYSDRAVEKDIELYHVGTTEAVVFADPLRIRQVIANLLDNAIRHTQPKGQIELSAAIQDATVVVSVRDTGEGIPEEFLPRVFDRFSRADPSRTRGTGGSGVGLAICRKLIEAHSGTISVESSVGVGTTFRVTLPLEV